MFGVQGGGGEVGGGIILNWGLLCWASKSRGFDSCSVGEMA